MNELFLIYIRIKSGRSKWNVNTSWRIARLGRDEVVVDLEEDWVVELVEDRVVELEEDWVVELEEDWVEIVVELEEFWDTTLQVSCFKSM